MWAKPRGFMGWLTSYRENHYISHLEEVEGGQRLRPLLFERKVIIGNKVDQTSHWFDYQEGRIDFTVIRNHQIVAQNCHDIPEGVMHEDILSAFYNLRGGAFGKLKKGDHYEIPSIPDQGISKYTVRVMDKRQERKVRKKQGWKDGTGFVLKLDVDKKIFGTDKGLFWLWMSEDSLPLVAVAEDAIAGVGDVIGRLK
jgi:hypothetical protein